MGDNTRSFLMLEQVKENEVYQRMPSGAKKGKKPNTVAVVTALAAPVAERMGLTIWDVRFEKEGSSWFLRIFIDKDEGLTMGECEAYTREMNKLLDEADPIDQSSYLEIGSPGVERELTRDWHFQKYLGEEVNVRLIRPVDGVRDFTGVLTASDENGVTIQLDEENEMTFARAEAAYVRLVDNYDYASAQSAEDAE